MKYAIDILTAERQEIVNELKKQDTDRNRNLENLRSIDKALKLLNMFEKNNVEDVSRFEFFRLPFKENCFASYRIMCDNEAQTVQDLQDENIELFPDDIILKRKQQNFFKGDVMIFNRKAKSLKMRRMYQPEDRLKKVRRTRLLRNELNTVPQTPLLAELKPKGD